MKLNVLLLILFFIYKCRTFELILKLDFSSKELYENFECGGDLYVDDNNSKVYQNYTLPPCQSFTDIGKRLNNFQTNKHYINTSIIILVYNYNESEVIKNNSTIGTIRYYCNLEIIIKSNNNGNKEITIDGSNSKDNFILFSNSEYSRTCENNFIGIKLNNLKFINWRNIISISVPISGWINFQTDITRIILNNITTINSNSFLNGFGNINTTILINNGNFSNIYNSVRGFISMSGGRITLKNSIFQNSYFNNSYLIDYDGEMITLDSCKITNITISNNPLLFFSPTKSVMKNILINKCNFNSNFLLSKITFPIGNLNFNQSFQNLIFTNNYFSNSTNNDDDDDDSSPNSIIKYIKIGKRVQITNETIGTINIKLNKFQIDNSNNIDYGFNLITIPFNFSNDIKINNSIINSNQFINLIKANFTTIEINNTLLNSKDGGGSSNFSNSKLLIGINNTIILNDEDNQFKYQDLVRNIKNGCKNCSIILNNIISKNGTTKNDNKDNNNKNSNNHNNDKNNNNGFKKLNIIPIVLVPSVVLIIILVLIIFRNNIKNKIRKNNHREQDATTDIIGSNISPTRSNHINNIENEPHIDT
ncbi:hypothetical protein ACTA71_000408 [Dictyostelium dimigraforme]